ncbi:hypothetical protein [Phocaeicola plebeius]|nr:hypothetical protein [Phocaeicola plebeius]
MKPKFMEAISDGDLLTIRLYLANELLLDPRGKSFNKMRAYAEMNIMNLYEAHDGTDFSEVSSIWDEELLFKLGNDLDSNFSKERLDFFEKVAKIVLKEKAQLMNEEKRDLSGEEKQKAIDSENSVSEEPQDAKKSFKERIKPLFKHKIKENIITPFKKGLKKMD